LLKTTPEIPYALIQTRAKYITHIAKYTLMLLDTQSLAKKPYYRCESLVGRQLEDALG
jgi:hypothetical protein